MDARVLIVVQVLFSFGESCCCYNPHYPCAHPPPTVIPVRYTALPLQCVRLVPVCNPRNEDRYCKSVGLSCPGLSERPVRLVEACDCSLRPGCPEGPGVCDYPISGPCYSNCQHPRIPCCPATPDYPVMPADPCVSGGSGGQGGSAGPEPTGPEEARDTEGSRGQEGPNGPGEPESPEADNLGESREQVTPEAPKYQDPADNKRKPFGQMIPCDQDSCSCPSSRCSYPEYVDVRQGSLESPDCRFETNSNDSEGRECSDDNNENCFSGICNCFASSVAPCHPTKPPCYIMPPHDACRYREYALVHHKLNSNDEVNLSNSGSRVVSLDEGPPCSNMPVYPRPCIPSPDTQDEHCNNMPFCIRENPSCPNPNIPLCAKHYLVRSVRPVYDECIKNIPVIQKVVRHEPVKTVKTVPCIKRNVVSKPQRYICRVPVVEKLKVCDYQIRTRMIPCKKTRIVPTVQTVYVKVPVTEKINEPLYKDVVKHVPRVCYRMKPVVQEKVVQVPIEEMHYRPIVVKQVVTVPVKKCTRKNFIEQKVHRSYCPCECC